MRQLLLSTAAILAITAACGRDHDDSPDVPIKLSRPADSARYTMQPGDIRITTTDSGVDLALLGDSISGGLSAHTLAKVKHETDTAAVKGSGFGADIERMVKGTVQSALATRVTFPLSAVRDVSYDGKRIVFQWNGNPRTFGKVNTNGRDVLESFSADDAQRFVAAVRARKQPVAAQ